MVIVHKVLVFWQFRCQFLHKDTLFGPNPSSNLKIKYWRFQNLWNLKINFGITFWDILTLYPHNSKSSLLTTCTFRYVWVTIIILLPGPIAQFTMLECLNMDIWFVKIPAIVAPNLQEIFSTQTLCTWRLLLV